MSLWKWLDWLVNGESLETKDGERIDLDRVDSTTLNRKHPSAATASSPQCSCAEGLECYSVSIPAWQCGLDQATARYTISVKGDVIGFADILVDRVPELLTTEVSFRGEEMIASGKPADLDPEQRDAIDHLDRARAAIKREDWDQVESLLTWVSSKAYRLSARSREADEISDSCDFGDVDLDEDDPDADEEDEDDPDADEEEEEEEEEDQRHTVTVYYSIDGATVMKSVSGIQSCDIAKTLELLSNKGANNVHQPAEEQGK